MFSLQHYALSTAFMKSLVSKLRFYINILPQIRSYAGDLRNGQFDMETLSARPSRPLSLR